MKITLLLTLIILNILSYSQEICDNGIDDDNDGLIDLKDTADCNCTLASRTNSTSLIPNPSFENRSCCPSSYSQLTCADNWQQASSATSDYFNTCDFTSHTGAPPNPLPDGNGYAGFFNGSAFDNNYKEYIGTCLTDTMYAGTNYQIQFYIAKSVGDLNAKISAYGTTSCANLPFSASGCPSNEPNWITLDSTTITISPSSWTLATINFTPTQNITAFIIGGDCALASGQNYYYIDNLILNETESFEAPAIDLAIKSGKFCQDNLVLEAIFDSIPNSFQWYKDSIAIVGETDSIYNVIPGESGSYQIRLSYDSGCAITQTLEIVEPNIDFIIDSNSACIGSSTGSLKVLNVNGGILPYQYKIGNAPFTNDSIFDSLTPGTYDITILDSDLCQKTKSITLESLPSPFPNFYVDSVCLGSNSNFINSSTGSYSSIDWSFGDQTSGNQTTTTFTHYYSTSGRYPVKLTIENNQGCKDSLIKTAIINSKPIVDFSFTNQCQGETYQFTNNTSIPGSTNTSGSLWIWFLGNSTTSNDQDPSTSYINSGLINVRLLAISPSGCSADTTKQIEIYPKPTAKYSTDSVCFGQITHFNDSSFVSTGNITSWEYNTEVTYTVQNPMHLFSSDGIFNTSLVTTTNNGCKDTAQQSVTVYSLPKAQFNYTPQKPSIFQTNICFENLSQNSTQYYWDFGFSGTTSSAKSPCIQFPIGDKVSYNIVLISENKNGCLDSTRQTINIEDEFLLYVPNSFSPNQDGINETFIPIYNGVTELDFYVFNRWGKELFHTNKITKGWNGTYESEEVAQQGTYIYKIIVKDLNRKKHEYIGHVNLLK